MNIQDNRQKVLDYVNRTIRSSLEDITYRREKEKQAKIDWKKFQDKKMKGKRKQ